MIETFWTVFPEDEYIGTTDFDTYAAAQEYADGLCCSYTIEEG